MADKPPAWLGAASRKQTESADTPAWVGAASRAEPQPSAEKVEPRPEPAKEEKGFFESFLSNLSPLQSLEEAKGVAPGVGNVLAGAARGSAGNVYAAAATAYDKLRGRQPTISELVSGKPLSDGERRRKEVDDAMKALGADPSGEIYKAGKFAGETALTSAVGGGLGSLAAKLGAPRLAQALSTGSTGVPSKSIVGIANRAKDVGISAAGGAATGAASSLLIDPDNVGTGAFFGAAIPGALGAVKQGYTALTGVYPAKTAAQIASSALKALQDAGLGFGKQRGAATQTAAASALKGAEASRQAAFNKYADVAKYSPTPIPTDVAINTLQRAAANEGPKGRRMFEYFEKQLKHARYPRYQAISSGKYDSIRTEMLDAINRGFDGGPLNELRAKHLNAALDELNKSASASIPEWGMAFDAYKKASPAVDRLSKDSGKIAGSITSNVGARDKFTGEFLAPPGERIAPYLKKGLPGYAAAAEATKASPKAREEVRSQIVTNILTENPSKMENAWAAQSKDLVKSGLVGKDDAAKIKSIIDEISAATGQGAKDKPKGLVGAVTSALLHVPGIRTAGRVAEGMMETADAAKIARVKELMIRASLDPKYKSMLVGLPTKANIDRAVNAISEESMKLSPAIVDATFSKAEE